jgi:hypothetical protein
MNKIAPLCRQYIAYYPSDFGSMLPGGFSFFVIVSMLKKVDTYTSGN